MDKEFKKRPILLLNAHLETFLHIDHLLSGNLDTIKDG